ncbi:unnamed protein product, partial [Didymodactylos carnosus]
MDVSEQEQELQTILSDTFCFYNDPTKRYILKLNNSALIITLLLNNNRQDKNYQNLNVNGNDDEQRITNMPATLSSSTLVISTDDIYGCLCMRSKKQESQDCHLTIYLYSSTKKTFRQTMQRSSKTYTYQKYADFNQNYVEMMKWHESIRRIIDLKKNIPRDLVPKRAKRTLVFINPAGGAGKAYKLFMEHVAGIFFEAEMPYHVITTGNHAGHARDCVQSMNLNDWYGIILASGDGLVYEVINGLLSRPDWLQALQLPIGHLPCGSGNALITSILRCSKQIPMVSLEEFVIQAAVLITTHNVVPMDMAIIDTIDGQRLFSFLSVEWATIADVDFESEKYRFLGETRFTIEVLKHILHPRVYDGYIDYLPYENSDSSTTISNNYSSISSINQLQRHLFPLNEEIKIDDNSKWRRINGPFLHVLITSKPCISKDVISAKQSTLADGYLTLQYVRSGVSRVNLAKMFIGISTGKHFDYNFVEWLPMKAFRIVPNATEGNIMVDGEKVPYGPIQGEVLPNIARCMGKLPNDQR